MSTVTGIVGVGVTTLVIVLLLDLRILLKFEKVSTVTGMWVEVANVAILAMYITAFEILKSL